MLLFATSSQASVPKMSSEDVQWPSQRVKLLVIKVSGTF
jgi:hypothetical protein